MRSSQRILERLFGLALLIATLSGCRAARPDVDFPWTEEERQAVAEVAADLERQEPLAADEPAALADAAPAAPPGAPPSLLEVYVFDIGQADSMLVIGPAPDRRTLLVDLGKPLGGTLPAGFTTSQELVSRRIRELTGRSDVDYFVLSHYHSDHAGRVGQGIIGLLSGGSFTVGEFIHVGDEAAEFMAPENERGVFRTIQELMPVWVQHGKVGTSSAPSFGTGQIDLGPGVTVDILAFGGKVPSGASALENIDSRGLVDYAQAPANENDLSVALQITAGEFELFTGGDLTGTDNPSRRPLYVPRAFSGGKRETYTNIEHPLVAHWRSTGRESDVEVYRANHHGSEYSTTPNLLNALDPEVILYSTGAGHGHPSRPVVTRGGQTALQLATTAVSNSSAFTGARGRLVGEIRIVVAQDGESYTVNGETHRAFSAPEEEDGDDEEE